MRESYQRVLEDHHNCMEYEKLHPSPLHKTTGGNSMTMILTPILNPPLNITQHMFLMFLIDYQITKQPIAEKESDGWFPCSCKNLEDDTYQTYNQQKTPISKLYVKGFLKRKLQNGTRWFWIDYDKIYQLLDTMRAERDEEYDNEDDYLNNDFNKGGK